MEDRNLSILKRRKAVCLCKKLIDQLSATVKDITSGADNLISILSAEDNLDMIDCDAAGELLWRFNKQLAPLQHFLSEWCDASFECFGRRQMDVKRQFYDLQPEYGCIITSEHELFWFPHPLPVPYTKPQSSFAVPYLQNQIGQMMDMEHWPDHVGIDIIHVYKTETPICRIPDFDNYDLKRILDTIMGQFGGDHCLYYLWFSHITIRSDEIPPLTYIVVSTSPGEDFVESSYDHNSINSIISFLKKHVTTS